MDKKQEIKTDADALTKRRAERGIVLACVLFFALIAAVYIQSLVSTAAYAGRAERRWWQDEDMCMLAAQSGLEKAMYNIYDHFATYFNSHKGWDPCLWLDTYSTTSVGASSPAALPTSYNWNGYTINVTVINSNTPSSIVRTLTFKSVAISPRGGKKTVVASADFGLQTASVFDYMVFLNNGGSGSSVGGINGDYHSNGNFTISNLTLAGKMTASKNPEISAAGTISGTPTAVSTASYIASSAADSGNRARPTDPPSTTKAVKDDWPMGYDGKSSATGGLPIVPMPYLGDLDYYRTAAAAYKNGAGSTLKTGTSGRTINAVYGDVTTETGPSGKVGGADTGMLVLVGTTAQPIEIDGPVVINGDVIIKGVVKGQGVIYCGRNIHIADSITYANPPSWTRQDATPAATAATNATKDLVCLAAQGNIVMGNYTNSSWYSTVSAGLNGVAYATDPADVAIGYGKTGTYTFNGDYTVTDGGLKYNSTGTVTVARKYYESSNDKAFAAVSPAMSVNKLDAVIFTNHNFMGLSGGNGGSSNTYIHNGARVSRDKALYSYNNAGYNYNWDIRIGSYSRDSAGLTNTLFFPKSLRAPTFKYWREGDRE